MNSWIIAIIMLLQTVFIVAHEPYQGTIVVGSEIAHVGDPNMLDFSRSLSFQNLNKLIPFYTPTSQVGFQIDIRGVEAAAFFATNSTNLVLVIPTAGDIKIFTGATRDDSVILFKDYIQDTGTNIHLLRAYAKHSPIDPIAGNPNSLMAQMGQSDYLLGRLSPLSGCECSWDSQPIRHLFQTELEAGRAFSEGFDTSLVSFPIRYSYSTDGESALILDLPLTYLRNGGASSVIGSIGFGCRTSPLSWWSLTPVLRVGTGGSLDLCTAGCFVSAAITSHVQVKCWDYVLGMTNYGGYFTSTNFWLSGVNFNYHLQNYVVKNGFSVTTCEGISVCDRSFNFSLFFTDSYFPSGRLFIRHYDEVGISIFAHNINPCLDYDCASLAFSYQIGEKDYCGYFFEMKYQF